MDDSRLIVDTKYFTFTNHDRKFIFDSGESLPEITIAYETYGVLNQNRDNAILILHALSGDAHVAGVYENDQRLGWWDSMVGPNKAIDTNKYFVICSNVIGGCCGSSGPSSINPLTKKPYALEFPIITIFDMVRAQKYLIDHLGIDKLLSVVGGSMGGMQVLAWAALFPDRIQSAIPIATTLKHSPQQIAFDEVGRQAIMADPDWCDGNYYGLKIPQRGLAVARMIGHITYMSEDSMEKKFSRRLKDKKYSFSFMADFEVEGYLRYRGDSFVKRFDANSYLYITKAMDYFNLSDEFLFENEAVRDVRFLVISFNSDWLYPSYQSRAIVNLLKSKMINSTYCDIDSNYGHDAFLLEVDQQSHIVEHFLTNTHNLCKKD